MPDTLITQIVDPAAYTQLDKLNKALGVTEKQAAEVVVQLTQLTAVFRDAGGVEALVKAQERYAKTTQQASAYERELTAQRKAAEKAAAKLQIAEERLDEVMGKQAKSIAEAREQNKVLTQVRNNLVVTDEASAKTLNELNAKLDKNNDYIKGNADAYLKQKINIGNYQSALDGLPGTLGKVAGGASKAITAVKGLTKAGLTFIATPVGATIAAIVALLALLKSGLSRTEEGQNRLAKASAVLRSVFQSVLDLFSKAADWLTDFGARFDDIAGVARKAGEGIKRAFADPIGTVDKLGRAIIDNILNRIKGVVGMVQAAWKIVTNLGNADLRAEGVRELAEAWHQAVPVVAKVVDKVNEFSASAAEAAKKSAELADRQAALDKANREFLVEEQRLRREINEQKERSLDTELSVEERLKANAQAIALQNTLTAKQTALAQEEYDIIRETNALHDSTKEDLEKEAQALAKVEQTRADGIASRRRLVTQQNTLEKEQINALVAQDRAALDARIKLAENAAAQRLKLAQEEYEQTAATDRVEAYAEVAAAQTAALELEMNNRLAVAKAESEARVRTGRLAGEELVKEEQRLTAEREAIEAEYNGKLAELGRQQTREAVKVAKEQADARLAAALRGAELEAAARKDALSGQLDAGEISYAKYAKAVTAIEKDMSREALRIQAQMLSQQLDNLNLTGEEKEKIQKRYYDAVAALREADAAEAEEEDDARLKGALAWLSVAQDSLDALDELASAIFERRLDELAREQDAIKARYDAEVAALQSAGYSDEVKQRKQMALEAEKEKQTEELAKKEAEIRKKQAIYDRGMAVMQATIAGAVAILQAFAQTGPIVGAVMAGIIGALTAVQIAAILAAPLPQYKEGREGGKGEWAIVGDGGRREVVEGPHGTYLTPAKPTLTYLQPGDTVYKSEADYARRGKGAVFDASPLVAAQERTTRAVERWEGVSIEATSAGLVLLGHKHAAGAPRRGRV